MMELVKENMALISFGTAMLTAAGGYFGGRAVTQYRIADLAKDVEILRSEVNALKSSHNDLKGDLKEMAADIRWIVRELNGKAK